MTRLWSLEGNRQWLDGGAMFGNVPATVWRQWQSADEKGRIALACRSLAMETQGKFLLCEVGIGSFFAPKLAERYGVTGTGHQLLDELQAIGKNHKDVDYVILSHLHFDHAGGLLPSYAEMVSGSWELLFPKAQYIVGKVAWERACKPHPRDRASFIPELIDRLQKSGRLVLVDGPTLPGVFEKNLQFRFTDGHTPGQMHTLWRENNQTIFFAGDLIPGVSWIHLPVTMGYDRFAEKIIDEKAALYDEVVPEKWWLFFTHDPQYVAAQVVKDAQGKFVSHDTQTKWVGKAL